MDAEPTLLVSALTGEEFDPAEGFVTDADGNVYRASEYTIAVDKATGPEGELDPDEPGA